MHICFICREYPPSLRGGGIASYIKEMATGLCNTGHQVTVICASDDTRKEAKYKDGNINIIRLRGGNFLIPQIEKKTFIRRFRSLYRFHSYMKKIRMTVLSLEKVDIVEVAEYGAESYYLKTYIYLLSHGYTLQLSLILQPKGALNCLCTMPLSIGKDYKS